MKPILFNTEMVRAILDGRKTVTRRVVKPQPKYAEMTVAGLMTSEHHISIEDGLVVTKLGDVSTWGNLPYRPGDILYVRETFSECAEGYAYRADYPHSEGWGWNPSIHMPREAARIFLRVTDVRVERLQDITENQARAEGAEPVMMTADVDKPDDEKRWHEMLPALSMFPTLWNSTIKPADRSLYGWEANPWVWVIEFERCEKPEGD